MNTLTMRPATQLDELLTAERLAGARGTSAGHRLHVEPDGSFSMVAIVRQPGALTRIEAKR